MPLMSVNEREPAYHLVKSYSHCVAVCCPNCHPPVPSSFLLSLSLFLFVMFPGSAVSYRFPVSDHHFRIVFNSLYPRCEDYPVRPPRSMMKELFASGTLFAKQKSNCFCSFALPTLPVPEATRCRLYWIECEKDIFHTVTQIEPSGKGRNLMSCAIVEQAETDGNKPGLCAPKPASKLIIAIRSKPQKRTHTHTHTPCSCVGGRRRARS